MKNAYQLKVKSANFTSILNSGSAYIALPGNNDQTTVIISNSWRNQKVLIKLKQIILCNPIEFSASINRSFVATITIPNPKSNFSSIKVNSFKAHIVNKTQIKTIINISYPN
ncbi:hypothetical protein [Pedobacter sp. Hv1]|uniref:hypothetical protein n=1 Tax=Pedobacter sp. Hv1 TaxID=1740090 RepID=UPI00128EEBCC|nr:hypothetical protein [Pedobacter sp. Hv1]